MNESEYKQFSTKHQDLKPNQIEITVWLFASLLEGNLC